MHPEVAWKAQFVVRVEGLVANCNKAGQSLIAAHSLIPRPIHVADAAAARARLDLALRALELARTHLDMAAIGMLAAELHALGEGSHNPAAPLASIQHLVAPNATIEAALAKLRAAYQSADAGCECIDWGRGTLSVIYYLLDHAALPNVDALIAAEYSHAAAILNLAAQRLADSTDKADGALEDLRQR